MKRIWVFGRLLAGRFGKRIARVCIDIFEYYDPGISTDHPRTSAEADSRDLTWLLHGTLAVLGIGAIVMTWPSNSWHWYLMAALGLMPFLLLVLILAFRMVVTLLSYLCKGVAGLTRSTREAVTEVWQESGRVIETGAEDETILLRPAKSDEEERLLWPWTGK